MQKTAKKFLSMLLALMMVLSILPTAVFATEQGTVAAPLDSIVPYGANDQTTGTATISVQNSVTFTGYSAFENVPYYLVTVPAGTTYVKATYKDAAILTNATSGVASGYYADVPQWTGGGVEMAYTESGGDITITIPLNYSRTAEDGTTVQKSFVLGADGSGTAYAPEYDGSASYAPVHFLAFTYEGKSAPTVAPGAIATANVTLGNAWTLDVAEMFTDADGDALTYTATVNGATQTLNGSTLSYTPTAAGEYTIVLTATDDSGTATHTIVLTAAEGTQVPRLKSGVPVTASATVSVGYAYNLSDLQAGNIFENPDGSSLSYTDYYYYRTAGTGERKGPYYFSTALFGATTIQITENTADTYVYEFHAMNSAGLSTDTWTLTLTVSDSIEQHYTFHVGQDMNYSTNGSQYPLIKLYKTAGLDDKGADYLASYEVDGKTQYIYEDHDQSIAVVNGKYMITVKGQDYELKGYSPLTFKASDFTTADPNSTGTLADNYNNFYASLAAGRYSFRAYGYKASETSANVYLGGHSLTLPTETNVDGGTGGGADIYLRLHSIYTTSKKNSSDYFTADDYTARVVMPSMGGDVQHGTPYPSGNYTYYPFMLYSAGNAALWNAYVEPIGTCAEDYIFTQAINNTTAAGYTVVTKSLALSQAINLTVTVPAYADFNLFFQHNNFNTQIIEPKTGSTSGDASASADATRTLTYKISKSNSNYTWRLKDIRSGTTYVTKAGWLQSSTTSFAKEFTFNAGDSTDQYSHSFSNLGTMAKTRDEAEIQTFLSPSGYKYTSGTERIRSYRLWQIINSDAANIMIEPEFEVHTLAGSPTLRKSNGGNAENNWLDVKPNGTTILAVNYKALDVYAANDTHGTHGGFYPATNPERTSVFVLSSEENGTATANIAYNSNGLSSSRPSAWDYNYDNWFYLSNDTAPTLDFTVASNSEDYGVSNVQYAIVTTNKTTMESALSGWTTLTADSNGKYHASLLGFRNAGLAGGTVVIKMTANNKVSYSLARVAEVTATVTNASNPQETEIMPGDKVSLTFEGSYRGIYKYSGIFNPTTYNLFYSIGDTAYKTNVAQYQQMDQAKLELTIPTNVDFGSGSTANVQLTNGYTYGSMYSAANPFATLYNMSNTGVGTNFNAVTVNFCLNRFPNVNVEVTPRYNFKLKLNITNPTTATPTVTLTDAAGNVHTANSNGEYENLPYGTYTYAVLCAGCDYVYGSFYLGSADKANVSGGVLTKTIPLTASAAGAWDGTTKTQPTLADGVYQIGNAAELAWFAAQVNGGSYAINGALTGDIDLAGYNWTPIGGTTASTAFKGSFNGNNHTVKNMGIYYSATTTSAPYKGLFGYVNGTSSSYATIQNLKVTGKMYLTSTGSVANAYSGGVVAYANYTNISGVVSDVDITVTRVNGNWSSVGGVAGRLVNSNATNCGNEGTIHAYQYVGGITGYATGTITGCYNGGAITGNGYVAGIVGQTTKGVTACYNTGSITGAGNYVAGIVAFASGASASVKNCYNRAYVESTGSNVGAVVGMTNNASAAMSNLYYLDFTCSQGIGSAKSTSQTATAKTRAEMDSADFVTSMNTGLTTAAFGSSRYSPALTWQTDLIGLTTPTVGNVNLDPFGYVDEEDLALLTEWKDAGKTKKDLTAEQWAQADLNDDGKLNDEDVEILAAYLEDPRLNDLS
ncbi:hypothetical protein LKD37_04675 [Oscillospiraceae bacterium CLA-AA-H272]|jgi:hypothetical protein|uniref:Dockerin domain-containing protein n=2 Tax=Brotocaccenecus cirricatena TaxID=3064195 RepID=A0AAE3ADJ1_9FIRM|nr:hypothetical protein [Brotocaccenecus cirricatena]